MIGDIKIQTIIDRWPAVIFSAVISIYRSMYNYTFFLFFTFQFQPCRLVELGTVAWELIMATSLTTPSHIAKHVWSKIKGLRSSTSKFVLISFVFCLCSLEIFFALVERKFVASFVLVCVLFCFALIFCLCSTILVKNSQTITKITKTTPPPPCSNVVEEVFWRYWEFLS